jgi:hypothetical protein
MGPSRGKLEAVRNCRRRDASTTEVPPRSHRPKPPELAKLIPMPSMRTGGACSIVTFTTALTGYCRPSRLHSASATKSNSGPLSYTSARPFKRKPRRRNGSTRLISMKGLLRRLRMVPGEGSQQTSLVNRLSCPTFPKSTIESQCVFSTLSHQIGGQDSLRGSNHRPKWESNQGYDAQLLAQCICWNAWAQARQSIR